MIKELSHFIIDFDDNNKDVVYICSQLENKSNEITNFFDLKDVKVNVKIFDDLDEFRNLIKKHARHLLESGSVPLWVCGVSINSNIYTLTLSEYRRTKSHQNDTLDDLIKLILHEFTHACFQKINNQRSYAWLSEGLATTLSHQYDNKNCSFDATLEDIIDGTPNYANYYLMFKYVLSAYGKEYILKLINNKELLENETPKLYNETINHYRR